MTLYLLIVNSLQRLGMLADYIRSAVFQLIIGGQSGTAIIETHYVVGIKGILD